jgi:hypothetical protein
MVTPSKPPPTVEPVDLQATADAQHTTEALETVNAQGTSEAAATASLAAEKTQQAMDKQATSTQAGAVKLTATAEFVQRATSQAQSMMDEITELFDSGVVGTTEGTYARLNDFDESWAQLGWWQYWRTGYEGEDFVISGDAYWSSASDNANWPQSGCAIVFAEKDNQNQNIVWMAMDGYAYLARFRKGDGVLLAFQKYGQPQDDEGQTRFTLAVYDKKITLFMDGNEVLSARDAVYEPGNIDITLRSGTNKDYGTRCQMTNVDLWLFSGD